MTPDSFRSCWTIDQVPVAIAGTVKAASWASGSVGGLTSIGPIRSAIAAAISRVCRDAHMPLQLMHDRPLLDSTDSTITSKNSGQSSTTSSPIRIFDQPGPWACTRALPSWAATVWAEPKIMLRGVFSITAPPTS